MTGRKWGAAPLPEGVRPYRFKSVTRKPEVTAAPKGWTDEAFDASSSTVLAGGETLQAAPLNEDNLRAWAAPRPSDKPADAAAWAKAQEATRQRVEADQAAKRAKETEADRIRREYNEREVRDLFEGAPAMHVVRVSRQEQLRLDLAHAAAPAEELGPRPVHRAADGDLVLDTPVPWYDVDASGHAAELDDQADDDSLGLSL